jgi:hypothetical protein
MRKLFIASGLALSLAACGAGVTTGVQSIFDQINAFTKGLCGFSFAFATIDMIIKAVGGPPVAETIGSLLCTQARALQASQAPKAATSSEGPALILGTVIINGKPVTIAVQR